MKNKEDKVKFVHSQTIKLKASEPLIPVELDFGNGDIKKFLIERMGSNSIRFVMPIPEEDFNKQKDEAQKKYDAIQKAQKILDEANEEAKTIGEVPVTNKESQERFKNHKSCPGLMGDC